MTDLFSHAAPTAGPQSPTQAVICCDVTVPVGLNDAFQGFTDNIHLWWPVDDCSEFGAESHVGFDDGELLEESVKGEECLWARVSEWTPPSSIGLAWLVDLAPLSAGRVGITFDSLPDGTTVVRLSQQASVPHSAAGEAVPDARDSDSVTWKQLLQRYARFMGSRPDLD
ncbi:hypothetical protein IV500_14475 [Paeniglutamicibacter antarcticus]|uniref:Activator of Hsp90 ATPase homolog 1-like protein n=1 Tax=Arthrobacter terrae TaxID=2935737 RepID=A0A931CSD6_9MICC|nr:hypothetical protein [Arthrobacter terrae]MBG0740584.1 hypothetical protein [Arthrobacter terrae]